MKLSQVVKPQFQMAFNKLMSAPLNGKLIFRLKKLSKKLAEDARTFEETRVAMCEKYAPKDENGKPKMKQSEVLDQTGPASKQEVFDISKDAEKDLRAELQKVLDETEVDLGPAIPFAEIEAAKLSAADLLALDDWIQEPAE